jgi:hypothetical protein
VEGSRLTQKKRAQAGEAETAVLSARVLAMINRRRVVLLGATILTFLIAVPAGAATLKPNQVDVEYVPPKSSAHDPLYKLVRERRLLEKIRDLLIPFRLPRRLLLKTEGCDGEVNAWYDDGAITVCYEYLDWVWQSAPQQTTPAGTAPIDTVAGSVVQIILHEAGHAVFDLLKVPIFGPEVDDADQFSAYVILQMGKEEARRLIAGAAYQYRRGVRSENQNIPTKRLADVHATTTQRFFNILCLAYGADNELFKEFVANGYLPKERADDCSDEYAQVAYAFKSLIGPYVDRKLAANFHKNWLPPINSPVSRRPAGLAAKSPE